MGQNVEAGNRMENWAVCMVGMVGWVSRGRDGVTAVGYSPRGMSVRPGESVG